ncbi:MAG: class I SAM-dependent rRNA methyltransferase [Deltaproteobacteria bacterium]|nr:class I SAM-dependent rRNA methyltransferase [Deltaproteobacteria bacterium]
MVPTATVTVELRKPLERALAQGHPWLWREALGPFTAEPGAVVTVQSRDRRFVARGLAEGSGTLAVRVFTVRDEALDRPWLDARLSQALQLRKRLTPPDTTAWRLLHGEGDRLPGVVCDVYGNVGVLSLDGDGARAWEGVWAEALEPVLRGLGVGALLGREGRGAERRTTALWGSLPEGEVRVLEHGMTLLGDLLQGQKTGLFLDQRESRRRVRALSSGLRVLNLYGYTGGFSVAAGLGGALDVTTVDSAPAALALATRTWAANGLDPSRHHAAAEDVPAFLAEARRRGARWDLVIADPPSFAPRESAVEGALKSYRALHAACLAVLSPEGLYLAGSCSSHVGLAAFRGTLADGAEKARRALQVLDTWGAPADHPCLPAFPEGEYLKNVLCRRVE